MMVRHALLAGLLLALAAGCATVPASQPTATPAPGTVTQPSTPPPSGSRVVVVDTIPSRDAMAVLQSIPEPLPPGQRVPPAVGSPAPPYMADSLQAPDSILTVPAFVDTAGADSAGNPQAPVPTPVETPTRPAPIELPPDTTHAAPSATASADTCWRVQIGAPNDRTKAEHYRDAGVSQLLVPFVIEHEGGLWKVRTRDCMSGAAADALKRRATDSGFKGVFRFVKK